MFRTQCVLETVLPKFFFLQVPKLFLCVCTSRKSISLVHTEPIRCCKNSLKFEKKFVDKNYFCHCNSSAIYSVFVSKQCFKTLVILEKSFLLLPTQHTVDLTEQCYDSGTFIIIQNFRKKT